MTIRRLLSTKPTIFGTPQLNAKAVMDMLVGQHPKKVLLLTATPVNNSLLDLDTLIRYFVRNDAQFSY